MDVDGPASGIVVPDRDLGRRCVRQVSPPPSTIERREISSKRPPTILPERPEKPIFGPEPTLLVVRPVSVKVWRSIAKAVTWRTLGTLDTLILSFVLITYLGPLFGRKPSAAEAGATAGYIATTEVVTKMIFYFLHEHLWTKADWGVLWRLGRRRESHRRTISKTATWRLIAAFDTISLAWFYTGSIATALSISLAETFTKLTLYFLHERAWAKLPFGVIGPMMPAEAAASHKLVPP